MNRRDFLAGSGAAGFLSLASCRRVPNIDLPEPIQIVAKPWRIAAGMMAFATFSARVLVLMRRDYPVSASDTLSAVSPTDLAVAWGPAAEAEAREAVELSQRSRRYYWRARTSHMGIPGVRSFTRYSGNWHMIPATEEVRSELRRIAKGDIVRIEGDLVQVTFTNGIYYKSSLSRDDTGDGACEIIRARSVVVER